MAGLLATSYRLKLASRYHADRPCGLLLVDGSQAGVTAAKNNAGSLMLGGFSPDALPAIADWKTAPFGASRWTGYSGGNTALNLITGFSIIGIGRHLRITFESGAIPIESSQAFGGGEVGVAYAGTTIGDTKGHADGRTVYGLLQGIMRKVNSATHVGYAATTGGSRVFVGAEATARPMGFRSSLDTTVFDAAFRNSPYWTSGMVDRDTEIYAFGAFAIGFLAYYLTGQVGVHWATRTMDGMTVRVLGHSATASHMMVGVRRKPEAAQETLVTYRETGTWASWGALLERVWTVFPTLEIEHWEQDQSSAA